MVVSESESVAYGKAQAPPPAAAAVAQEEAILKDNKDSSLARQNSVFSLTLDEIQCKSGKTFGSMNMDEFLASVWSVEDNHSHSIPDHDHNNNIPNSNNTNKSLPNQPATTLARQASLSIPISLCNKTVDEVWFEIHKDHPPQQQHQQQHNPENNTTIQRQPTLGEITLEDFLIKAGVVQEPPSAGSSQKKMQQVAPPIIQEQHNVVVTNNNNIHQQSCHHQLDPNTGMGHHVMGIGFPNNHHHHHQNAGNNNNGLVSGNGFAAYQQIFSKSGTFAGESSNGNANNANVTGNDQNCHGSMEQVGQKNSRKRIIDGPPEVVVERRQRRMIKNRESAARSRARRQAYTVELELELNQLREENAKLKQILEEIEQKRKEEVMKRKQSSTRAQKTAEKLRTIRRTMSF